MVRRPAKRNATSGVHMERAQPCDRACHAILSYPSNHPDPCGYAAIHPNQPQNDPPSFFTSQSSASFFARKLSSSYSASPSSFITLLTPILAFRTYLNLSSAHWLHTDPSFTTSRTLHHPYYYTQQPACIDCLDLFKAPWVHHVAILTDDKRARLAIKHSSHDSNIYLEGFASSPTASTATMVYCGKPSKGCSNCRERKIRCDQKAPECGQCVKRHQTCRGYRNITDLMFRDESSHVISKAARSRSRSNVPKKHQGPGPASLSPSPRLVPGAAAPKPIAAKSTTKSAAHRRRPRGPVLSVLTPGVGSSPSQTSTDSNDGDVDGGEPFPDKISSNGALVGDLLDASFQERGIDFFFSRYVTADNGYQNYSFIYDVWKPRDQDSTHAQLDAVTLSMAAVGLAIDSQLTRCTDTMIRAYQNYGMALTLTRTALRDPVDAIKDTTLLAVLILGTYEFVSGHSPQTMQAWQGHVNGAAVLASMRGSNRFRNRANIQMFIMLSQSVLISCIQSELPMPQVMVDLSAELQPLLVAENPVWRVVDPIYRALQVRDDIKTGKLDNMDDIIDKLSQIDDEFTTILAELPPSWNYRRILLTREDNRVFGRWCHVYPGLVQATTWNGVRAIRMLVLEATLEQLCVGTRASSLDSLPRHYQMRLTKTIKLLGLLREAIVASVPQHFGVVSFRDGYSSPGTEDTDPDPFEQQYRVMSPPAAPDIRVGPGLESQVEAGALTLYPANPDGQDCNAECFMTLASASNTIIWPLYVLGISSSCPPEMKQYAIIRLRAIHHETGLEQARVVAEILQAKGGTATLDTKIIDELPELPEGTLPPVV